jgi:hypothetical protein
VSVLKTTIEWNQETGEERDITVTYIYHSASRGARDSLGGVRGAGPPLEPDEPECVEIESVMMHSTTPNDPKAVEDITDQLSDKQIAWLEEECLDDVRESYNAAMEDKH